MIIALAKRLGIRIKATMGSPGVEGHPIAIAHLDNALYETTHHPPSLTERALRAEQAVRVMEEKVRRQAEAVDRQNHAAFEAGKREGRAEVERLQSDYEFFLAKSALETALAPQEGAEKGTEGEPEAIGDPASAFTLADLALADAVAKERDRAAKLVDWYFTTYFSKSPGSKAVEELMELIRQEGK